MHMHTEITPKLCCAQQPHTPITDSTWMHKIRIVLWSVIVLTALCLAAPAFAKEDTGPRSVYLEELTSPEVAELLKQGTTTVLIPTGGTEQNGPHMALGKHNRIVEFTAGQIARKLGNTLVAPVIAYVPQGAITPPEGHMRFAGTLSISESTFRALLEDSARSLKQHGFTTIVLIGDHGASQPVQKALAEQLSAEWKEQRVRVLHIAQYYESEANGQAKLLKEKGFTENEQGTHAGIADTSELWAVNGRDIRRALLADHHLEPIEKTGATGDSTQASATLGRALLERKIEATVRAIRDAQATGL